MKNKLAFFFFFYKVEGVFGLRTVQKGQAETFVFHYGVGVSTRGKRAGIKSEQKRYWTDRGGIKCEKPVNLI